MIRSAAFLAVFAAGCLVGWVSLFVAAFMRGKGDLATGAGEVCG